ncbi:hypothetical protein DFH09DRAFT_1396712 [Mycena vulgaris]|nr:hypothetical protein DFH09DRAFT_1396712 [Mycena vulgaris]
MVSTGGRRLIVVVPFVGRVDEEGEGEDEGEGEGVGEGEGESVGWDETMVKGHRRTQHGLLLRAHNAGQPLAEGLVVDYRRGAALMPVRKHFKFSFVECKGTNSEGGSRRREVSLGMTYHHEAMNESASNCNLNYMKRREEAYGGFGVARTGPAAAAEQDSKEREGHGYMNCRTGEGEGEGGEGRRTERKISGLGLAASSDGNGDRIGVCRDVI